MSQSVDLLPSDLTFIRLLSKGMCLVVQSRQAFFLIALTCPQLGHDYTGWRI